MFTSHGHVTHRNPKMNVSTFAYGRDRLVQDIAVRQGCDYCYLIEPMPTGRYLTCRRCRNPEVLVHYGRWGDGSQAGMNWLANVWYGICRKPWGCGTLNVY